jgi:hypothetical protein
MTRHQNLTTGNLAGLNVIFSEVVANPRQLFFLETGSRRINVHDPCTS